MKITKKDENQLHLPIIYRLKKRNIINTKNQQNKHSRIFNKNWDQNNNFIFINIGIIIVQIYTFKIIIFLKIINYF